MHYVQPLIGAAVILAIGVLFSTNRRAINWPTVGWGLGLQVVFAFVVLKTAFGQALFETVGGYITRLLGFSSVGAAFVFGPLGDATLWGRTMSGAIGPEGAQYAVIFAFQVLPTIIFIASLFAILYYLGVMQLIVRVFAVGMRWVMKASGAETLNVAASIFMGQTEAPLTIRPYLAKMTQSELMTVMTSGMAHISGGIMAAYVLFGSDAASMKAADEIGSEQFRTAATDERFRRLFERLARRAAPEKPEAEDLQGPDGKVFARVSRRGRAVRIEFAADADPAFADRLAARISDDYARFLAEAGDRTTD